MPKFFQALGGCHEDAVPMVSKLFKQLASHASKDAEKQTMHLFQRHSLLLIRGNAASILNTTLMLFDGNQDLHPKKLFCDNSEVSSWLNLVIRM